MVGRRRFGWMGGMACGSTLLNHSSCSVVRLQQTTRLLQALTLFRNHNPVTQWFGWWRLFYSFRISPSSLYNMQSTSTSTLTTVFSLYSYSLHLDSQRPPSFTRTCTRNVNNQQQTLSVLTARLPKLVSPFLLTYQQLHTYSPNSRNLLSCMANQIPWSIHKPITKDPIASNLNHFLDQSLT